MQDVELVVLHRVEKVRDRAHGQKVPRGVEHRPAPAEARRVPNRDACRVDGSASTRRARGVVARRQLRQRLQASNRTVDRRRVQRRVGAVNADDVRLVSARAERRVCGGNEDFDVLEHRSLGRCGGVLGPCLEILTAKYLRACPLEGALHSRLSNRILFRGLVRSEPDVKVRAKAEGRAGGAGEGWLRPQTADRVARARRERSAEQQPRQRRDRQHGDV